MDFFENLYTDYSPSEDVHLEFSYWFDNFSLFKRLFFLLLDLVGVVFITRNTCSVLKLTEPHGGFSPKRTVLVLELVLVIFF